MILQVQFRSWNQELKAKSTKTIMVQINVLNVLELHIIWHQSFGGTNHAPRSQMCGLWALYFISFAAFVTRLMQKMSKSWKRKYWCRKLRRYDKGLAPISFLPSIGCWRRIQKIDQILKTSSIARYSRKRPRCTKWGFQKYLTKPK